MINKDRTVFLDAGEMTFKDSERLNFIMNFYKKGATDRLDQNEDGTFVRADAEISFSDIWLACAKTKQSEIDALKAEIAELKKAKVCVWELHGNMFKPQCSGFKQMRQMKFCSNCGGKVEVK